MVLLSGKRVAQVTLDPSCAELWKAMVGVYEYGSGGGAGGEGGEGGDGGGDG